MSLLLSPLLDYICYGYYASIQFADIMVFNLLTRSLTVLVYIYILDFPPMTAFPTLTGPTIIENGTFPYFTFDCHVHHDTHDAHLAQFEVTFLFNGQEDTFSDEGNHILRVPVITLKDGETKATLKDVYLRGRMEKWAHYF